MTVANKPSPFSKQSRQPSLTELNEFMNRISNPMHIAESKRQAKLIQNAEISANRLQELTRQDIQKWQKATDSAAKGKIDAAIRVRSQQAREARLELARLKRESAEHDEMMALWPFEV